MHRERRGNGTFRDASHASSEKVTLRSSQLADLQPTDIPKVPVLAPWQESSNSLLGVALALHSLAASRAPYQMFPKLRWGVCSFTVYSSNSWLTGGLIHSVECGGWIGAEG